MTRGRHQNCPSCRARGVRRHSSRGVQERVVSIGTSCLGCVYVFSTDATFVAKAAVTPVGDDRWTDVDAVVYFWVRRNQMESGVDERLLAALGGWFENEWKLARTVYVVSEPFTQQVDLMNGTDLVLKFELVEPSKLRRCLVFG